MKYIGRLTQYGVSNAEDFNEKFMEKENPDSEYSLKRYRIIPLNRRMLEDVGDALAEWAEHNARESDWDEEGRLKPTAFHADELVSDFLARMFDVERKLSEYTVTVTFNVQAENEDDARQMVEDSIDGHAEYYIDSVDED